MKVITFSQRVTVNTMHGEHLSEITCNPGVRLIFDDDNAASIATNTSSNSFILELSDLDAMLRDLPLISHYKKRRVLFYRNRGHGDQLILSGVARFFREVLQADVRVLSDRVHEGLWHGNPFILGVPLSCPLGLDAVWRAKGRPFFDRSFFIESLTEWDTDGEQPNVYDRLYALCGIDPERVNAKYKRPVFALTNDDCEQRSAWLKRLAIDRYILVQLRAANKGRSLPLKSSMIVLQAVNDVAHKKGLKALLTDDKALESELVEIISGMSEVINAARAIPSIRLFGALVAGASAVVGPDSSALHFAAAAETPALGLWGPFSPESRAKYYPRQAHIWHSSLCPSAPCFNFLPELPAAKCPHGAKQQSCECFDGVTYDEVYSALLELLQ
jgi:ADP-heptose:LPS heptosyltransferase